MLFRSIYKDSLKIYALAQNGASKILLYAAGCLDLATLPGESLSQRFIPSLPEHWKWDSINIDTLRGMQVGLMLEAKNDNGNQLFIDDISVYPLAAGTQISKAKNLEIQVLVYPVPATNQICVEAANTNTLQVEIASTTGQILVNQKAIGKNILQVDLSAFPDGIFILKATTISGTIVKRFVKK